MNFSQSLAGFIPRAGTGSTKQQGRKQGERRNPAGSESPTDAPGEPQGQVGPSHPSGRCLWFWTSWLPSASPRNWISSGSWMEKIPAEEGAALACSSWHTDHPWSQNFLVELQGQCTSAAPQLCEDDDGRVCFIQLLWKFRQNWE